MSIVCSRVTKKVVLFDEENKELLAELDDIRCTFKRNFGDYRQICVGKYAELVVSGKADT